MDIKLRTSELLLKKLAGGCGDAQLHAVAEIRLFSKWDDANRVSLAKAGAIALLLKILDDIHVDARVQENAMAALVNISINSEIKMRLASEPGGLEAVMRLANDGGSSELKANAAALLYSLLVDDGAREIVCRKDMLWATLTGLLRSGSSKCTAETLKALFVLAKDEHTRETLLQEKYELIGVLLSLLTVGKVKLTEDCLAVLGSLASCEAGAKAVMREQSAVLILVYLLNSGSARAQENVASVLLNVCRHDEGAKQELPMKTLIPALNNLLMGGSERGRGKAEALLRVLEFDNISSISEDPNSYIMGDSSASFGSDVRAVSTVMPFIPKHPAHINFSPPQRQSKPHSDITPSSVASSSASSVASNASWPKAFSKSKVANFARSLFTHKARKASHSSIN